MWAAWEMTGWCLAEWERWACRPLMLTSLSIFLIGSFLVLKQVFNQTIDLELANDKKRGVGTWWKLREFNTRF